MLTYFQYRLLKKFAPHPPTSGDVYADRSKVLTMLGADFYSHVAGKLVIDFGCGYGDEAVEMAQRGPIRVIGIDLRESVLEQARKKALAAGVQDTCSFVTATTELADVVVSLDAFEHFEDPAAILRMMNTLLKPGGTVHVSFGPTWYHPLGGHLFSVFPWAHLLFSEKALMRWRSDFKTDGATHFGEVAGGLNQMTITYFEQLIAESPFQFSSFEPVPIRKLRCLHCRLTREFTVAVVRCRLMKRPNKA